MKKASLLLLALLLVVAIVSCGEEEPEPTTGTISGTLTLQAGMSGDLNNARVGIYASYDDWNYDRAITTVSAQGSGGSATYTFSNVTPGTYYLDAWKDVNNNQSFDTGDLFGVYGTTQYPSPGLNPFSVSAGQTSTINVDVIVLP